jgi:hypothetical protein
MQTRQRGLVAILDALGAATYSDTEIDRFLESRDLVLERLNQRADAGKIDKSRLRLFTFNDTVVIVFLAAHGGDVTLKDIETFSFRLRAFMMHSFENRILFRGSLSVGGFRLVDDKTNTVMGAAVSDAAAWYDKTDWVGIAATPLATMFIQSLLELHGRNYDYILIDYAVPLRGGARVPVKVVNWPKGFYVKGLRPNLGGGARSMLLSFLAKHNVPFGAAWGFDGRKGFRLSLSGLTALYGWRVDVGPRLSRATSSRRCMSVSRCGS